MYPFRDSDAYNFFQRLLNSVISEINSLENEYVIKASEAELEEYYKSKVLLSALVLYSDQHYIKNQTAIQMDVSHDFRRAVFPGTRAIVAGTKIVIAIPFEGDSSLWKLRASTYGLSGYPEIRIGESEISFSISFPDDSADTEILKSDIERNVRLLEQGVGFLRSDINKHNNSAENRIKEVLQRKRQLAHSTVGVVASLGIPVKRNTSPTFTVPAKRRVKPIKQPTVETEKYQPEPVLDEKEYQNILKILRSMSLVIERNPSSFSSLHEESIRDHFLLQLNGHYEGGATGETFNASGKTDILIREGNKNVFIAECKFWRGPKGFRDAVSQLLSYLTWRDSKCALMIFNQNKDSSSVRRKMHEVMSSLTEHKKTVHHDPSGDSRYILVKATEPGREIIITTQLYDI